MLEAGAPTDILSGRPLEQKARKKKAKVTQAYRDAARGALDLATELQKGSPVVTLLAQQYQDRLVALAADDPEWQAITRMIQSLRGPLELLPKMAEARMLQIVGPALEPFLKAAT